MESAETIAMEHPLHRSSFSKRLDHPGAAGPNHTGREWPDLAAIVVASPLVALVAALVLGGVVLVSPQLLVVLAARLKDRCFGEGERREPNRHLSICDFARDFERRSVDPWVIRSVWNMCQKGAAGPLRASTLIMDSDLPDPTDLEWVVFEIGLETSHDIYAHAGKFDGPVMLETIGDLVRFVSDAPYDPIDRACFLGWCKEAA